MQYKGFVGGTYTGRSLTPAGDRCINLFPESTSGTAEASVVLLGTPGTALFCTLPTKPVQRIYTEPSTERVFAVAGGVLYEVLSSGAYTTLGTVGAGPYSLASNSQQIMIACAGNSAGYILTLATNALTQITAAGFLGTAQCVMIDSYFVSRVPNSRKIQVSSLMDGTQWDALDFALSEGGADNLVGMVIDHKELILMSSLHAQPFVDSGDVNFPLTPGQNTYIEQGLAASDTLVQIDNTFMWLGRNQHGQARVFRSSGYQPVGVSTRAVEWFFNAYVKYGGITNATAYGYQDESGHSFYVISFPSVTCDAGPDGMVAGIVNGATWVYDCAENMWHERSSLVNGVSGAHVSKYHTTGFSKHLVGGGDTTGHIYTLDSSVYQDNGSPIKRVRRAPHVVDELKVISYHKLRLSAQVGSGPVGDANNKVMLRWSNDGGATWSDERQKPLGDVGNRQQIIEWRMLGRSTRRSFEVSTTVNGPVCLVDAFLELAEGSK